MGVGAGIFRVRHKRIFTETILESENEDAPNNTWLLSVDSEGNNIPARIRILGILIHPTASTIRALRIYSKATRINDPANADYSLIYEDAWTGFTAASDELTVDSTERAYIDDDAEVSDHNGTIHGSIEIQAGQADAAFVIDVYFIENG